MAGAANLKNFIKDVRDAAARKAVKLKYPDLASDKNTAGNPFFEECVSEYEKELQDWLNPYGYWIEHDPWEVRAKGLTDEEGTVTAGGFEYVYICTESAVPAKGWKTAVKEALKAVEDIKGSEMPMIIYGDEDLLPKASGEDLNSAGAASNARRDPFFKPDYSHELLKQFNYLGEMVLIRRDILDAIGYNAALLVDAISPEKLYEIIRKASKHLPVATFNEKELKAHVYKGVLHVPHILSHRTQGTVIDLYKPLIEESEKNGEENNGTATSTHTPLLTYQDAPHPRVSVIIPTKDHPEVLRTCLSSFREKTLYEGEIQIVVVDNGSAADKKAVYEEMSSEYNFEYIYDPQPFNYSHMNNVGLSKATGELVLLLNDDTEVITGDWLSKMAYYASKREIGAVGAKLLYAGTDKIQHAGVTNLAVGPSHKILAQSDAEDHYFGRNKLDYNMLAVTGACLMVSREKLCEVGGLNEDLKVAYNDMDLCFKLFEKGYRCVQCNGAVLYHYESLTRGMDEGDEGKYLRLLDEKEKLYALHPWAKGFDPFYSENMIDNSADYLPSTKDCTRDTSAFSKLLGRAHGYPKSSSLVKGRIDRISRQLRNTDKDKDFIWMDGWSFVRGCDNRRFTKSLVLTSVTNGEILNYELFPTYRKDISAAFKGERNLELAGFYFRVPTEELGEDSYNVGVLECDIITGKRLYRDLGKTISAKG
jgi:GT2 family glycosyltransferase